MTNEPVRKAVLRALACASGLVLAAPVSVRADPARFNIAAEPLPDALKSFAAQAKMQLLYPYELVSHATAHAIVGELEKHAALDAMLEGTGLEAVYSNENTATIRSIAGNGKSSVGAKPSVGDKGAPSSEPAASPPPDKNAHNLHLAEASGNTPSARGSALGPEADFSPVSAEVVVVGVKQALSTSQWIKREANTFVDSITATDFGTFPDKSASDALQRLPGVTVNRLQSNDDSTHPSGEPTNILIRGLTQVRTEFNGRDTFSADSARGLNFNDVSPELLSGADAYKNQTADMIEGGIAGTVDLRTRLPFDQAGPVIVGALQGDYGDRSKQLTPAYSVLASDSISTDLGRFGLLLDYSRSHVITRTQNVIMDKIDTYCSSGFGTADHAIVNANGSIPCTSNPFGGAGWAFVPDGIRYSQVDYDRDRIGSTIAAQYQSPGQSLLATLQYTDSGYRNKWLENASHAILEGAYYGAPGFDPRSSSVLAGSSGLVFGSNGMLQSGLLTQPHGSWAGSTSSTQDAINTGSAVPGLPFVNYCGASSPCASDRDGMYFQNEARDFDHSEDTKDLSVNVKWDITPRLHSSFDAQYVDARVHNNDILVASGSMANYQYSLAADGMPQVTLLPGSNVNYAPGGLSNPHNYWIPFIQGHVEKDGAVESAFRGDLGIDIDKGGWLDSLKVGVRHADRTQSVRYSTYNWTPIVSNWGCNGPAFNADNTSPGAYPSCNSTHAPFLGYGAGIWGTTNFNDFYNNGTYPNGPLVFLNNATITNMSRLIQALSGATTNSPIGNGYTPICARPEATVDGCFTPSEVEYVEEKTDAGYVMLNFGGKDTRLFDKIMVVGNVGVRVVRTEEISSGSVAYPDSSIFLTLPPCGSPLGPNVVVNPGCYLTPQVLAFASGGGTANTFSSTHTNALPSFNVRFGLDDKDFVRFAYSRAMARPDIGLLRNYVSISTPYLLTSPDSPYVIYNSPTAAHIAANVVGYKWVFSSQAGNAGLLPEIADQFDLSFEHYFSTSSSLTLGLFFKELSNSLSYANFGRDFTHNGATETTQILGPVNEKDGGRLKGIEAAYQTFFDFLPKPLSGLGMQVNYTYVDQTGIHNSNLIDATSGGGVGAIGAGVPVVTGVVIDSHSLAGVSQNTFNLVGLYESGPVGLRLAYNWRSRYLTANLDCCIGLPVYQKAAGFLDGSARVSVGPHVELSLDVANILDTKTVYQQQIFGDTPATPGAAAVYRDSAWSLMDRRYQAGVRVKF